MLSVPKSIERLMLKKLSDIRNVLFKVKYNMVALLYAFE